MNNFINAFCQKVTKAFKKQGEESFIENQRRYSFYYTIALVYICILLYAFIILPPTGIYHTINQTLLVVETGLLATFMLHKLSIKTTLSAMLISIQLANSIEIVITSLHLVQYPRLMIMAGMLLSLMFIMISICSYMNKLTILLAALPLVSFTASCFFIEGEQLQNYLLLTILLLILATLLGNILYHNTIRMQDENLFLKKEERKILKSLNLSREELFAFVELASQKNSDKDNLTLFETIGPKAKENLLTVFHAHQQEEQTQTKVIQKVFPELSASEQAICRLILQDKTIGEICEILMKSPGNITSQRTHIRAKLGLKKEDNLKEALQKRMQKQVPTT